MKAVIGIGFGDEGKGLVVDYQVIKSKKESNIKSPWKSEPLVIRFSGGQQAGHNVVIGDINHIFSNFGSGTLRGVPTYWSKFCSVDPVGIIKELKSLKEKGFDPILYIDGDAPVTTPYDKFHNKNNDDDLNHGTCGVGVGPTFNREEHFHHLSFSDIFNHWILETKLNSISDFYGNIDLSEQVEEFYTSCFEIIKSKNIKMSYGIPKGRWDFIFEGSQGLLLDQHYGFFPHVARTNTGTKNILEILKSDTNINIDIYMVTRAYQTRHGNGPMTNTNYDIEINNYNETNVDNKYQGKFRKSILDVSLLEYAINKDEYLRKWGGTLVITCLDHLTEYAFTYNGDLILCENEKEFINKISTILKIKNILISKSNKSENIK